MFPLLVIAIGIAVLAFGKRLAVLGAAVGALLGVGLLTLFPESSSSIWFQLGLPALLAAIGFFVAGIAKGFVRIVILVMGAVGGAAIVLAFFDLFNADSNWLTWALAALGGVVGVLLVRRYKNGAMIVLASLVGGFLITRGLGVWFPTLTGTFGTLLVLLFAAGGVLYQGGFLQGVQFRRPASASTPQASSQVAVPGPATGAQESSTSDFTSSSSTPASSDQI